MNKLTIFFLDAYATQPDKIQTTDIRTTANIAKTVTKIPHNISAHCIPPVSGIRS
jgi:hypothetical protein